MSDARLATQARDASDGYNSYSPIPPRDVSASPSLPCCSLRVSAFFSFSIERLNLITTHNTNINDHSG